MQSGEYYNYGSGNITCEAVFKIDGAQYIDTSGTFTITASSGTLTDENFIASGFANLVMSSGFGANLITHTIRVSFENIRVTDFGGC